MEARFFIIIAGWAALTLSARASDALKSHLPSLNSRNAPASQLNEVGTSAPRETVAATNAETDSKVVKSAAWSKINPLIDKAYQRLNSDNIPEALHAFNDALILDPVNKRARFGLGTTYIQLQRYHEALEILEPMVKEFPNDYLLKNNIAWLYATAKNLSIRSGAKAVQFAQDALLMAPRDFHVWSTLSEGYYISGKYDKALRAAEEALRLSLDSPTGADRLEEYRRQVDKNRMAAEAMSVFK